MVRFISPSNGVEFPFETSPSVRRGIVLSIIGASGCIFEDMHGTEILTGDFTLSVGDGLNAIRGIINVGVVGGIADGVLTCIGCVTV